MSSFLSNNNITTFGVIIRPHGLNGGLKCNLEFDGIQNIKQPVIISIDDIEYTIISCNPLSGDFFILYLSGIDNITKATALKNKTILINADLLERNQNDDIYINDLLNCEVICNEKIIGYIDNIVNYGASDIMCIRQCDKTEILLPIMPDTILEFNIITKTIILNASELEIWA